MVGMKDHETHTVSAQVVERANRATLHGFVKDHIAQDTKVIRTISEADGRMDAPDCQESVTMAHRFVILDGSGETL